MAMTESQKRYAKRSIQRVGLDFYLNTEKDLLDWINSQPTKRTTYIKDLIRADMERKKK